MKCFYHRSDFDGHCSGAIVKYFNPECEMIGINYDEPLDADSIGEGETIYVVDFSFSSLDMSFLHHRADLIWIDHHKSAIEKVEYEKYIKGIRRIGKAACELTWEWFRVGDKLPLAVYLLGRYDVWDHEDERVLPFQYGLRIKSNTLPDSIRWRNLLKDDNRVPHIIEQGELILKYEMKQNAIYAKSMSYERIFHKYRALVINKPFSNSKIFDSVYDPEKHDIMVIFGLKEGKFKYSLFCNKPEIDVSKIAVHYGGGGHAGAAGFYSDVEVI